MISSAICGLWKIYKCLFIPNCTRKIMWLLINNIHEKISCMHVYHAIRETLCHQLRHPGRALDLKTKDLIGHLWVSLIIDQSECLVCFLFLHWINSFLHCLKKNCTALNQSQWRNFFMYIIRLKNSSQKENKDGNEDHLNFETYWFKLSNVFYSKVKSLLLNFPHSIEK